MLSFPQSQLTDICRLFIHPDRKPRDTDGGSNAPSSTVSETPAGDVLIRVVTITGSPSAAQMAQFLITQKLQLVREAGRQAGRCERWSGVEWGGRTAMLHHLL